MFMKVFENETTPRRIKMCVIIQSVFSKCYIPVTFYVIAFFFLLLKVNIANLLLKCVIHGSSNPHHSVPLPLN